MEKQKTCCFTGHRKLPQDKIEQILIRLNQEVDNLISQGITDFIVGGALGFDQVAASLIVVKKEMGHNVRLIFALPYKNQDMLWSTEQKKLYHGLLDEADEIIYVSEEYIDGCIQKRDRYMIERSGYCICTPIYETGEKEQAVKYAREIGVEIINIA